VLFLKIKTGYMRTSSTRVLLVILSLLLASVTQVSAQTTYYSFVSGNWNDPNTWTTDPSGTLPPPVAGFPGFGDEAVILSGRTVTLSADVTTNHITIMAGGVLNLSNHKIADNIDGTLKGQGTLKTSNSAFTAAFATKDNSFFDANGGTMEFNFNQDVVLYTYQKKYNNLTINLANGKIATFSGDCDLLTRTLIIHGNLTVLNGTFRIGSEVDLGCDNRVVLDIRKNVVVGSNGSISVGKANTNTDRLTAVEFKGVKVKSNVELDFNDPSVRDPDNLYFQFETVQSNLPGPFSISNMRGPVAGTFPTAKGSYHKIYHQVYVGGDFTNNGTVKFHNLTTMVMDELSGKDGAYVSATSGAASVFFQGAADNTLTCNGVTDFYNLVVDKGTDATYKLTVTADAYAKFRLWGPNNLGGDGAFSANPVSRKALWLKNGTLRLTGQVIIPSLSEGSPDAFPYKVNMIDPAPTQGINSDFAIPANATLLIDGEDVIVLNTADYANEIALAYGLNENNVTVTTDKWAGEAAACSIYGTLQINSGYMSGRGSAGFVFWNIRGGAGNFNIKGGRVDAMQVRSAIDGGGRSTFDMSGGELRLRGRFPVFGALPGDKPTSFAQLTSFGTNPNAFPKEFNTTREVRFSFPDGLGTLNIDQDAAVFNMSGGKIHILDVVTKNPAKAIEINSTYGNYQVTGGEMHVYLTDGGGVYNGSDPHITVDDFDYYIASAAPLANLYVHRNVGATKKAILTGITPCCGRETSITTRRILPLTVVSNLQINSGATLDANGQDVLVGGNFTVASTATYLTGIRSELTVANPGTSQTTTFNGNAAQTLTVNGTVQVVSGQDGFNSLTMNKPSGTLTLASDVTVRKSLTITQGTLPSANGVFDDGGKTVRVTGDLYNDATHAGSGKIQIEGGIASVTVTNPGVYTLPRMAGVGGSGATFRMQIINGVITSIDVVNGGSGFGQDDGALGTFTFSGVTGSGAEAKYSIKSGGVITAVILKKGGSGYGPTATAGGGANLQTIVVGNTTSDGTTPNGRVIAVDVANPGAGYATIPAITFPPNAAGQAAATANVFNLVSGNGNGRFSNLTLDKPAFGAMLTAAQTVNNTLTLTNGILDIGIYQLSLTSDNPVGGAPFSPSKMIRTAGNQSDGGVLRKYSNASNSFLYPLGTGLGNVAKPYKYTPATIQVTAGSYGTLRVRTEDSRHPFATGSNNTLRYYWKVSADAGFGSLSSVNHTYNYVGVTADGDEAIYIPGVYNPTSWNSINDPAQVDEAAGNKAISFTNVNYLTGDFTAGQSNATGNPAFNTVRAFYSRKGSVATPADWFDRDTWSYTNVGGAAIPGAGPNVEGTDYPGPNNPVVIGDGVSNNHYIRVTANNARAGGMQLNAKSVLDIGTTTGNNFGFSEELPIGGSGILRISSASATAVFPDGDFGAFIGASGGTVEYYTIGTTDFTIPQAATLVAGTKVTSLISYRNLILNPGSGRKITLPSFSSPTTGLVIYGDLKVGADVAASPAYSAASATYTGVAGLSNLANGDVTVNGNIEVYVGTLQFQNNASSELVRNVVVGGDVKIMNSTATFNVSAGNTPTIHQLTLKNNLVNNGVFDMRAGTDYACNVTFTEINNNSVTGTGATTNFNILTIDKGTFQTPVLEVNATNFTLPSPGASATSTSTSPLVLKNGTFRLTSTQDIELTRNASFTIPATACLSVNGGTITVGNSNSPSTNHPGDLLLAGKLEVLNGTMNVGTKAANSVFSSGSDNDIRYATVGFPEINVAGGSLLVIGSIRKSFSNDNIDLGALVYKQTGGTVVLGNGLVTPSRPKLEIDNPGSVFDMSGGTIRIFRGGALTSTSVPAPGFGDLYLNPASSTVTGGRIVFYPGGNSRTFNMDVRVPLWNLEIMSQSPATCRVILNNVGLVVKNNLYIREAFGAPTTSTFDANGFDVTVGGTFMNRGVYLPGNNTTTFNKTNASFNSVVNLGVATTFNNVVLASSGTTTFGGATFTAWSGAQGFAADSSYTNSVNSVSPVIKGNLTIGTTSTVDVKTNTLNVSGNVINNNTVTSSSAANVAGGINLHRSLASAAINNVGAYSLPTVTAPNGSGAEFNIIITDGVITNLTIANGGTGYNAAGGNLSINGLTNLASYTVGSGVINSVNLTSGGTGFGPTATVTGGGGTGATAQVVINGKTGATGGTGTVSAVNVILAGTNFQSTPAIAFSSGSATAAATITALPNNLSGSGKCEFGNLTINNNLGATTSSNVTVNGTLNFNVDSQLNIFDNRLVLGTAATVSNAGSLRYIRTNGALSDLGLRKRFNGGNGQSFTFPVGTATNYTPVSYTTLNITMASNAFINLKPVNAKHPNVGTGNALNYYWNVTATGGTFVATQRYQYLATQVGGDENLYKDGRLISGAWIVGVAANVDKVNHAINLGNTSLLSGDYTAAENFNALVTYTSNAANMNWAEAKWTAVPNPSGTDFGPPTDNSIVIIQASDVVNVTQNTKLTNKMTIAGTLDLDNTIRHNFGTVDGIGKLRISATSAGDFVFPAGTYANFVSSGGGTVEYYGSQDGDILTRRNFNNVIFSGSSQKRLTEDLEVAGNLTISGGTVNNSANSKTVNLTGNWVQSAGTFNGGSGTVNVKGSFNSNGGVFNAENSTLSLKSSSLTFGTFNAGTSTVSLDSTLAQTLNGSASFYNLIVNGGNTKSLGPNTDLTVNGTLTLNNGWIITSTTNMLKLGSNASTTGASNKSFVLGPMEKEGNNAFTFPIGALVVAGNPPRFAPIGISSLSGNTTFRAQYLPAAAPSGNSVETPLQNVSALEHWNVINVGSTTASAHVTLHWGLHSQVGDVNTLVVAGREGLNPWKSRGGRDPFGTISVGYITSQDLTAFTSNATVPFTFGNTSAEFPNPLPIRLLDFNASLDRGAVYLDWQTLSEDNSSHFEIERSGDGEKYVSIGRVEAKGFSRSKQLYGWMDMQPLPGTSYYRLKMVDMDGSAERSKSVAIHNLESKESVILYPNPVDKNGALKLQVFSNESQPYAVSVFDLHGRELAQISLNVSEGFGDYSLTEALGLPKGMYIVWVRGLTLAKQFKLIVQ
jgi:fibronectin-binding autotransporter adhesin